MKKLFIRLFPNLFYSPLPGMGVNQPEGIDNTDLKVDLLGKITFSVWCNDVNEFKYHNDVDMKCQTTELKEGQWEQMFLTGIKLIKSQPADKPFPFTLTKGAKYKVTIERVI